MNTTIQSTVKSALLQASQGNIHNTKQSMMAERELDKIEETAKEFEAVFVAEMMKPMFKELKTDGMFGGGKGEEVFRGMMLQEYGKNIASSGTLGIADNIKAAMIRMQAEANGTTTHSNSQTPDTKKETV